VGSFCLLLLGGDQVGPTLGPKVVAERGWYWVPLGLEPLGCDDAPWLPGELCVCRGASVRGALGLLKCGWVEVRKAGSLPAPDDQLPQGSRELHCQAQSSGCTRPPHVDEKGGERQASSMNGHSRVPKKAPIQGAL